MAQPFRGPLTNQYQIDVQWNQLDGANLKGSTITSYYLQWDLGTNGTSWTDLVGYNSQYLQHEYLVQFSFIVPGRAY